MGKFTETPYFFLETFLEAIKEPRTNTGYSYSIDLRYFTSSFEDGDINDREYSTEANTSTDIFSDGDVVFIDWESNTWGLDYSYDQDFINTFNSYVVAPMTNIITRGGGLVDLYVKERDYGYLPITVRYKGHEGNEFQFENAGLGEYEPGPIKEIITSDSEIHRFETYMFTIYDTVLIDTFSLFENNRETYWRKDSLYHDWLRKYAHDHFLEEMGIDFDIRKYNNTDKIFMYFQNIFKSHDEQSARIIFDGLKDYVLRAVPEHQRTPNFTELCNIFFDRLYHEVFNLLKDVWSLIDPMEVDDRYLGYLSKYYDMFDVELDAAPLLQIREFIRDMIWMIKRKGTYTEFYILWRILTATKNILNIYERWHPFPPSACPNWPTEIDPWNTDTWPNYPYYSNSNDLYENNINYYGTYPFEITETTGTTVVPASAWKDVLYIYRDEYEAPIVSGGAGHAWYKKWYPTTYRETLPPSATDNLMLSTHYVIETDISFEPLDAKCILTKDIWDRMYNYWEYVRPVNRVSNYRIVEAPITDLTGEYIELYKKTRNSVASLQTKSYIYYNVAGMDVYIHDQDTITNRWIIRHKLGEDVLIQVFDFDLNEIIPKDIEYTSSSTILTFETSEGGFALVKKAQWASDRTNVLSDIWRVYHSLPDKEIIINYKLDNFGVFAGEVEIFDDLLGGMVFSGVETTFDNEQATGGVAGLANFIHIQSTPSKTWDIGHDLNMTGVMLSVYDENNMRIHPSEYTLIDRDECRLEFDSPVTGHAVIISIGDLNFDVIIQELMEQIENITWSVFSYPASGGRIEVVSGEDVTIYNDDEYWYFDIRLPKEGSYVISEIELYGTDGDILFHSIMDCLYKPDGVEMIFHYRLDISNPYQS